MSLFNSEKITIGMPMGLMTHRYGFVWKKFWEELGADVLVGEPTNREIMQRGEKLAGDEMCLSVKIFLGQVETLIGKCDYIMIPRISNYGVRRYMCSTFEALPDLVRTIFERSNQKYVVWNVDIEKKLTEEKAYVKMAADAGFGAGEARRACRKARKAEEKRWSEIVSRTEKQYKEGDFRILLMGHSYVTEDAYIGEPVIKILKEQGATVIRADQVDRKRAIKDSAKVSPTLKWELSRELTGSLLEHWRNIDGIVILSVYPCNLDSMTTEMMIRKMKNSEVPMLNLVLDSQTGIAGIETRIESFADIVKMRKGQPI